MIMLASAIRSRWLRLSRSRSRVARPPTSCSRMWTSTVTILRGGRVRCARRPFQLWDRHPQAFEFGRLTPRRPRRCRSFRAGSGPRRCGRCRPASASPDTTPASSFSAAASALSARAGRLDRFWRLSLACVVCASPALFVHPYRHRQTQIAAFVPRLTFATGVVSSARL